MKVLKKNFSNLFINPWVSGLFFLLLMLVLTLLFFNKVLFKGQVPLPGDLLVGTYLPWSDYLWGYFAGVPVKNPIVSDAISFVYPLRTLGVDLINSGQWPLWNPYLLNGTPLLANFQSAPFSPTVFLYFIFDQITAWSWQVILQHVLAILFTYLFLRNLKLSRLASLFGAIVYAFSGFCLLWSQWNAHTLAASFLPLLLYFTDKWLTEKKYWAGVGLSISLCMQFLSGYPQIVMYTLVALGTLWLVRIYGQRNWFYKSAGLFIFLLLGIGLSSPQLLPANELVGLSQRNVEPIPLKWVFLHPRELILFIAPDYFGNHATGNYWGYKNYLVTIVYVGIVPWILGTLGLVHLKGRMKYFFLILIVGSLVLALYNPVSYYLWSKNILGLQAGVFYKSLVLFTFSAACLSGYGFDYWLKSKKLLWRDFVSSMTIPGLALLGYGLATVYLYLTTQGTEAFWLRGVPKYTVALKNLIFPSGVLLVTGLIIFCCKNLFPSLKKMSNILIFGLLLAELFRFGWKFSPFVSREFVYPLTPVWEFLIDQKEKEEPFRVSGGQVTSVNLNVPYKIEFLGGYDAVYPLVAAKFAAVVNSDSASAAPQDRFGVVTNPASRLTNLMNMKYLLIKSDTVFDTQRFVPVFNDKTVTVLENKQALSRAFMVYDWDVESDPEKILAELLKEDFPLDQKIYIDDQISFDKSKSGVAKVENILYQENRSIYQVATDKDGLLFVSDTYYPGWEVTVDGRSEKIYKADSAFRAVPLSLGSHTVEFSYDPDTFRKGLKLMGISIGLLIVIYPLHKLVEKRNPRYT